MSGFDVAPGELVAGAAVADEVHEALRAELSGLCGLVADVRGRSWRGAAAAAFGSAFDEWATGAREALAGLGTAAALLRSTGGAYSAAEDASVLTR